MGEVALLELGGTAPLDVAVAGVFESLDRKLKARPSPLMLLRQDWRAVPPVLEV